MNLTVMEPVHPDMGIVVDIHAMEMERSNAHLRTPIRHQQEVMTSTRVYLVGEISPKFR
jgi:hypothetical protein